LLHAIGDNLFIERYVGDHIMILIPEGVMPEAYIYDHVSHPARPRQGGRRAARGDGTGARHRASEALKDRNNSPRMSSTTSCSGWSIPSAEAGSDIARFAALKAGLGPAVPGVQISRFLRRPARCRGISRAAPIMSGHMNWNRPSGAES